MVHAAADNIDVHAVGDAAHAGVPLLLRLHRAESIRAEICQHGPRVLLLQPADLLRCQVELHISKVDRRREEIRHEQLVNHLLLLLEKLCAGGDGELRTDQQQREEGQATAAAVVAATATAGPRRRRGGWHFRYFSVDALRATAR